MDKHTHIHISVCIKNIFTHKYLFLQGIISLQGPLITFCLIRTECVNCKSYASVLLGAITSDINSRSKFKLNCT